MAMAVEQEQVLRHGLAASVEEEERFASMLSDTASASRRPSSRASFVHS
jgi:hypothetical protein